MKIHFSLQEESFSQRQERLDRISKDLIKPYDLSHLAPCRFGIVNEPVACRLFERATGLNCDICGLFVLEKYPYIGASPDRIVIEDGVKKTVEIKCSYKLAQSKDPFNKLINEKNLSQYLELVDNQLQLKENHDHYYQVQGQMLCSGTNECYFVIYNGDNIKYFVIERNNVFIEKMVKNLKDFYEQSFKDMIIKNFFYREL